MAHVSHHATNPPPRRDDRQPGTAPVLQTTTAARLAVRYGISLALILTIVAIRLFVIPAWSLAHPYLLFYPAVALAGWFGGFGPGLVAAVLAPFALTYFWLPPLYSMRIRDPEDATGLLLLVAVGFAISLMNEARLRAKNRAHKAPEDTRRPPERETTRAAKEPRIDTKLP